MREKRGWTQAQLANLTGMTQNGISRLEDENYGNLTVNTILRIAEAFDVALIVKIVPFSKFLQEYKDVTETGLVAESFAEDKGLLETPISLSWYCSASTKDHIAPQRYSWSFWAPTGDPKKKTLPKYEQIAGKNREEMTGILPFMSSTSEILPI